MSRPFVDDAETHPSWGTVVVSRTSQGPTGASLFQSDVLHREYVTMRVTLAQRRRDLHRDWVHGMGREIVEIKMSFAQWAEMLCSFSQGSGTPCTISRVDAVSVEDPPFEPRSAAMMDEVRDTARRLVEPVEEAFAKVSAAVATGRIGAIKKAVTSLGYTIKNLPANATFTANSVSKHAENVSAEVKVEIAAYIGTALERAGLAALGSPIEMPELGA